MTCLLPGFSHLIIDEPGNVPLSPTGAELRFEVFSQRYERGSINVTRNLPFDEWASVFASEPTRGMSRERNMSTCRVNNANIARPS